MLLITIPFSHYCEKARWGLDHASIPFVEQPHLPGFHRRASRRLGGGRTVPVLVSDQGVWSDSTDILHFCDRQAPGAGANARARGQRLYPTASPGGPANGNALADVTGLEDLFDDKLGPHVRRIIFFHGLPDRGWMLKIADQGVPGWQLAAFKAGFPLARSLLRRLLRLDAAGVARSEAKVAEIWSQVEARLADGRKYLSGDNFSAADLTFAALAGPLLYPPEHPRPLPAADAPVVLRELRDRLRATAAGEFVLRMYRDWRHPRG